MTVHPTRRWRRAAAIPLLAGGLGLVSMQPSLLLVAVVGVVYVVYPRLTGPPEVDLAINRTVRDPTPAHGSSVEVIVEVENTGDRVLPDVRLVDGVPSTLSVTAGSPRHAAALAPGGTTTFTYTVEAIHGRHRFEPTAVILRDLAGAYEVETELTAPDVIDCRHPLPVVPVRRPSRRHTNGPLTSDTDGGGVEFQQTREYRAGDAIHRIDWRRFAKTGTLSTVEFGDDRAASIVLVVDTRESAYRAVRAGEPHGATFGVAATAQLLSAMLDAQLTVGLAAIGRSSCWLPPNVGDGHHRRAMSLIANHPAFSPSPPNGSRPREDTSEAARELERRLWSDQQLVLISPLADGSIVETALELEASGHAVTVISPDVTADHSLGSRFAGLERRQRVRTLRAANVPVVDWSPEQPLGRALLDADLGVVP